MTACAYIGNRMADRYKPTTRSVVVNIWSELLWKGNIRTKPLKEHVLHLRFHILMIKN